MVAEISSGRFVAQRAAQNHYRRMFKVAIGNLRHRQDAEDVVQDTLVRLIESRKVNYDDSRPIEPWIDACVRNRAFSMLKRRKRLRKCMPVSNISEFTGSGGDDGMPDLRDRCSEDYLTRKIKEESIESMREYLAGLQPIYREVINAYFLEGRAYAQIVQELNIPLGTLKSRMHNGLRLLRGLMAST